MVTISSKYSSQHTKAKLAVLLCQQILAVVYVDWSVSGDLSSSIMLVKNCIVAPLHWIAIRTSCSNSSHPNLIYAVSEVNCQILYTFNQVSISDSYICASY